MLAQTPSFSCLYHARMVLSAGGAFACFTRNARCTVTTDLLCDIPTHKTTSPPGAAIFSLHTLASPSGRNVNFNEKQLTGKKKNLSYSFYLHRFCKYASYGFTIINASNSGLHYETPCILLHTSRSMQIMIRHKVDCKICVVLYFS